MQPILKIFFFGMMISFVGSLPPGTMTITATFISSGQGIAAGIIYATGSIIAEMIAIILILHAMNWISKWHKLFFAMEIFAMIILFTMTVACFYLAAHSNENSHITASYSLRPFYTGFLISILNPVHIPFWMGWSIVLMNRNLLKNSSMQYTGYVTGIMCGSMLGFIVYIYGGHYVVEAFSNNQQVVTTIIGISLLVTTFLHAKKLMLVPASVRYSNLFKQRGV